MIVKDNSAAVAEIDPMYRMPADFGPLPGPRNVPAPYRELATAGRILSCWVRARTEAAALQAILPPGLSLADDPVINFQYTQMTNLGWLAGRGYNVVAVSLPVISELRGDQRPFEYLPVLWESLADPILTGREELGHPKLPASIPDPQFLRQTVRGAAHWEGFRFCEFEISGLRPDDRSPRQVAPYLTRKYVPRTGEWGSADLDQLTAPGSGAGSGQEAPPTVHRRDRGEGSFRFFPASWEDMPTQYPVVCRLAEMPLLQFVDAGVTDLEGGPGNSRIQGLYQDLLALSSASRGS